MNIQYKEPFFLSLGENCLADNILQRHGLKSFSSPYSSARSNITYAIKNEAHNYENLLSRDSNILTERYGKKTVVNTSFSKIDNIFDIAVNRGFEFTHHNIIEDKSALDSYIRKVDWIKLIKKIKKGWYFCIITDIMPIKTFQK